MAMKGWGREQQGLKTLDTLPWGLTWLWVWTCGIWGAKGLRARAQREIPAGAVRRTAAVGQVTVGAAVIRCKRLMREG